MLEYAVSAVPLLKFSLKDFDNVGERILTAIILEHGQNLRLGRISINFYDERYAEDVLAMTRQGFRLQSLFWILG